MNSEIVKREILQKIQYGKPYYATNKTVGRVITDFDDFPYNRWYRGIYKNPNPVIIEREAGYRHVENNCYTNKQTYTPQYPKHCFEGPCSVVYPCFPEYLRKYSDKEALEVMLNRVCVDKSP